MKTILIILLASTIWFSADAGDLIGNFFNAAPPPAEAGRLELKPIGALSAMRMDVSWDKDRIFEEPKVLDNFGAGIVLQWTVRRNNENYAKYAAALAGFRDLTLAMLVGGFNNKAFLGPCLKLGKVPIEESRWGIILIGGFNFFNN